MKQFVCNSEMFCSKWEPHWEDAMEGTELEEWHQWQTLTVNASIGFRLIWLAAKIINIWLE